MVTRVYCREPERQRERERETVVLQNSFSPEVPGCMPAPGMPPAPITPGPPLSLASL